MHVGTLTPLQALGIPVALVGSLLLAAGAELQHRGVRAGTAGEAVPRLRALLALLRRPVWLMGTGLLALAIPFQLLSLFLAPLTVIQPLGAAALVLSTLLDARARGRRPERALVVAVALCVVGIGLFVAVAAATTTSRPVQETQLVAVLAVLAVVLVVALPVVLLLRTRLPPIALVLGAGVLFGFVGSLTKVVLDRLHTIWATGTGFTAADWSSAVCVIGMGLAGGLGAVLVQTAYASGPASLVVAGLTVVDPVVGVTLGVVVLGEAAQAPAWAPGVFALTGAVAVAGVVLLARHRPVPRR
ncbi:DMT family transporter [Amnibacterium setariae]|uniref:Multidrug DMT transporter permease n=1 Tax=Amnibacterium setariae TaxID=2306585 RepID=A0A3A1TWZ7_9MICO|nr:DMT family transporter [Amnibacterium setariae]RIX28128.1 multidrug DMT transporter permease [Amnibacterium setariae]